MCSFFFYLKQYHVIFSINASRLLRFLVWAHLFARTGAVFVVVCHSQSTVKTFAFFCERNILVIYIICVYAIVRYVKLEGEGEGKIQ